MNSNNYLLEQIEKILGGDKNRVVELFSDDTLFNVLVEHESDSDWLHYVKRAFDGWYLVRGDVAFEVYCQDRGTKSGYRIFGSIQEAAKHFFKEVGYVH